MTLKNYVEKVLNGETVKTVVVGGISDSYENAIQHLALCAMARLCEKEPPEDKDVFSSMVSNAVDESVKSLGDSYGYSGAQVGGAKNITAVFWRQGPDKAIQMMLDSDPSRVVDINRFGLINPLPND